MKKIFLSLNALLFALIIAGDILYMTVGGLAIKGATSAVFVLIGALNLIYLLKMKKTVDRFPILMLFGLLACMVGDIVLNIHFIVGALIFALGHIFYFSAYAALIKPRLHDVIPIATIFVASAFLILFAPFFDFGSLLMQMVCLFYALVISLMLGKAIANLSREKSICNRLIAIGCCLFFFSDLMLVFDFFSAATRIVGILCLATYYPAQALLGFSIFTHGHEEKEYRK